MPYYDRICCACGWQAIDVVEPVTLAAPPCPDCGEKTERAWLTTPAVHGDEMDQTITNGTPVPIRFRSKSEFRRWKKEQGLSEAVRHVGKQGSDKSAHTTNWAAVYDPYTAQQVQILLERAFHAPTVTASEPLRVRTDVHDMTPEEVRRYVGR